MIRSLNKTPARGKPRLRDERIEAKPSTFSRVKFGTVIADLQLIENVTYQDFLDLMEVFERIEAVETLVHDVIKPQVEQNAADIVELRDTKLDKEPFANLVGLKNLDFDDTAEVTTGLCMIRDAFVDALEGPSSDELERIQQTIRKERASKFAKRQNAIAGKLKVNKTAEPKEEAKPESAEKQG